MKKTINMSLNVIKIRVVNENHILLWTTGFQSQDGN